jgi:PAS domain S-box-containing protein
MGKQIVIVEDERIVAEDIKRTLQNLGYDVPAVASTSEEAINKVSETRPDLVLMDIMLKGATNGIDTARHIHAQLGIPVVYLTAYSDKKILEKAMATDPYGYIVKPFSDRELLTTIESALSKHQLEKKLVASEAKFRDLFESASDVIMVIDAEGNIMDINQSAGILTGYTREELLHFNVFHDLIISKDRHILREIMEEGLHNTSHVYEIRWEAKGGRIIILEGSSSFRLTEEGGIDSMRCILRDIGERKRAENMLKLLKEGVESLPIGITISDIEGKIVYINPAEARIHGYTVEELIGQDARVFAPEELWSPLTFDEMHLKGIWKRESINIRKNSELFPVQLISIAVKSAEGTPIGIVMACEDITDRKKAEEELIKRQEALHSVYKMATTLGGSFKAICDEVVLNITNLLRTSHAIVLQCEDSNFKAVSAVMGGKLMTGELPAYNGFPFSFIENRKEVYLAAGSMQNLFRESPLYEDALSSFAYVPVLDTSDNIIGAVIVLDYSEHEFTDGEIQLLEIFSRYIAHEIEWNAMETRLRQMEKMKVYGQLTAGVAHEVRNPLNAILAITEALFLDLGEKSEFQSYLTHIRTQVDRLSRLMEDLLELGKPLIQSRLKKESLIEICSSVIDLWNQTPSSLAHKVHYDVSCEQDDVSIIADNQKLQQVFLNLLDNASQHSPEGSEIRMKITKQQGNAAQISVTDEGTGIQSENLSRVFEPFFTVRKKGTGLGLSIVKHIVEAHGGHVKIWNNDPQPGCTVEVSLPVIQEGHI